MYLSRTGQRNPRIYKGQDTGAHTFIHKEARAYVFIRGTGVHGFIKGVTQEPMDCTKDGAQEPLYSLRTMIPRTYRHRCVYSVHRKSDVRAQGGSGGGCSIATEMLVP